MAFSHAVGGGEQHEVGMVDFTRGQRASSRQADRSRVPSSLLCNLNAIMCYPACVCPQLAVPGWITQACLHQVLP